MSQPHAKMRVVLFTGGRGSSELSRELIKNDRIDLTLAINGYDNGLSTGEVRRFLGDSLGPSDFRKNASRLASELHSCQPALVELLDLRLPKGYGAPDATAAFRLFDEAASPAADSFQQQLASLIAMLDESTRWQVSLRLEQFEHERVTAGKPFTFSDCSLGNLVFVGCFLALGRDFNLAVADYCNLLRLPSGVIENVTDGRNLYLVAVDRDNRILATEAEIVSSDRPQHIKEIHLLGRPILDADLSRLAAEPAQSVERYFATHAVQPTANPRLLRRLAEADLIVYTPGTQHSSLFPSYLTPGVGAAIARNLHAIKVLITNLQEDAEIAGNSAVDLINRALYYLREKGRLAFPTPSLITHYLINDATRVSQESSYVPLGHLETLEDPRLVRIGNYEDGITGRHDATKILPPFIEAFLRKGDPLALAVVLLDADSLDKASQTIVEMVRAGIDALPVTVTAFYGGPRSFDPGFTESVPFHLERLSETRGAELSTVFDDARFEYVLLFESSGMYKGEDIVSLASHLTDRRLDAVWGSRRLSVNDIKQAYALVYRHSFVKAAISRVGSHVLSLAYLLLYGRYIADTLSGVRAIRAAFLRSHPVDPHRRDFNQVVLSGLLRERAEVIEAPVHYFPISPQKIRRTTVADGLRSLVTIVRSRFGRRAEPGTSASVVTAPSLSKAH